MAQSNEDRIEDIYHAAKALPESERGTFVEKECGGDSDCVREVSSLLEAGAFSSILDDPVDALGAEDDVIGTTIDGRYLVESDLPHGGMGKVYRARDLQLPGRFVVIKVLPHASAMDAEAVRRFKQEVKALTLIDQHQGVVSVLGAGELNGKPYIVMQYIDGPTLRSEIPSDGMDVKRAAALISQIGAAVGHIHVKGILHRDLKPENIMLQLVSDGTEVVKIVDFGIAKIMASVGATGSINTVPIGTIPYMSPEQLRSGEQITAASDIYSMAVVACEMITGKRPVQPDPALLGKPRVERVELPPGVPANARRVIAKALSLNPKNRYQSAKQFGADLAASLVDESPLPPPRKWLVLVPATLIIALVSFGIFKYVIRKQHPTPAESKGFNYWITVQRTRDGKDYHEPQKSNGDDVFDNGDKFQLNVLSLDAGYLYIFNDGPLEPGSPSFKMIYPRKEINDGSASIAANNAIQSDWIVFHGSAGSDNFWIVWSVSPVSELEFAKYEALKNPQAGLTDHNLDRVKEYLQTLATQVSAKASRMKASNDVQVRKKSDIVLTLAKFEHH